MTGQFVRRASDEAQRGAGAKEGEEEKEEREVR